MASGHAITVTVGVADWQSGGVDDLIKRADAALYAGKADGRNAVAFIDRDLSGA